ncbi:MAG: 2-C-methyl-D-erythritol 2,4-cyclodiphosphate synthase [Dehalococcoidia bacterium]|nr:2-C-methyl-D-erythritol 2,4-cyclodiphosphate synthase [Dehalococcoidia bacterium]HRC62426.1 2-C-methyl-D-erythritol 2,4-cyclodiphosphate synthase [Dehalococcoidia bacterium]
MRIGIGYDIHRFRESGTLRLGGIEVPDAPQLDGHSDGDGLIHAIIDALLGAAGEGDIGRHFPPGDPSTEGIDSRELLTRVVRLVVSRGYRVHNIDATVVAERPRLATHLPAMRDSLARCLGVPASSVNVKATTNERLDALGTGEALAAMAVALLEEEVP